MSPDCEVTAKWVVSPARGDDNRSSGAECVVTPFRHCILDSETQTNACTSQCQCHGPYHQPVDCLMCYGGDLPTVKK
jgi:hypothetical protein